MRCYLTKNPFLLWPDLNCYPGNSQNLSQKTRTQNFTRCTTILLALTTIAISHIILSSYYDFRVASFSECLLVNYPPCRARNGLPKIRHSNTTVIKFVNRQNRKTDTTCLPKIAQLPRAEKVSIIVLLAESLQKAICKFKKMRTTLIIIKMGSEVILVV